jgi:hypothetical protein
MSHRVRVALFAVLNVLEERGRTGKEGPMRRLSYLVTSSIIALVALVPIAGAQSSEQTVPTQEATSQDAQGSQQTGSTQEACTNVDPKNFVSKVDNKFFPLKPGTTFFYKGERDGVPTTTVTFVTHQTKQILGVNTTVVRDRLFEKGVLAEDTFDWYAQDKAGNVCYFGEDTKELDKNGNVISTEGSWEAGKRVKRGGKKAKPGIIMEANPKVGDTYHQEFATGVAEDMAQVLKLNASACVPYGCFNNLLVTKEWTPLEPGVAEHKYYARDVGFIRSVMVKGGKEHTELVRITTGN